MPRLVYVFKFQYISFKVINLTNFQ
jgi:hypothetical protein